MCFNPICNKGIVIHTAIKQVLPDVIESQYEYNKRKLRRECIQNQASKNVKNLEVNKLRNKKQISETNKTYQQNRFRKVLIKNEQNGTCT